MIKPHNDFRILHKDLNLDTIIDKMINHFERIEEYKDSYLQLIEINYLLTMINNFIFKLELNKELDVLSKPIDNFCYNKDGYIFDYNSDLNIPNIVRQPHTENKIRSITSIQNSKESIKLYKLILSYLESAISTLEFIREPILQDVLNPNKLLNYEAKVKKWNFTGNADTLIQMIHCSNLKNKLFDESELKKIILDNFTFNLKNMNENTTKTGLSGLNNDNIDFFKTFNYPNIESKIKEVLVSIKSRI